MAIENLDQDTMSQLLALQDDEITSHHAYLVLGAKREFGSVFRRRF
jgi:hypothetical protein